MIKFTQAQIAAIERSLAKMEQDLHADKGAGAGGQKYIELAGLVHDRGDESVASEMVDVDSAMSERHGRELDAIKVARERLASGKLNECDECGEEIGYMRLLVYPMAVRCIECQERFDATHAHEARPRL
jgi:RNA polymerase-binding transcription factor DksA